MVKIISTIGPYHDNKISREVTKLQQDGFSVTRIERISKELWIFGKDVTHIFYDRK